MHRTYSILVVPDGGSAVRRFRLSTRFLPALLALATALTVILAAGIVDYVKLRGELAELGAQQSETVTGVAGAEPLGVHGSRDAPRGIAAGEPLH